ncbi:MAG: hypothetical protein ABIQ64_00450 [Candidatus Saccharimonadales bacterium]
MSTSRTKGTIMHRMRQTSLRLLSVIASLALILGLSVAVPSSASALNAANVSGAIVSVDPVSAANRQIHTTYEIADDQVLYLVLRFTDSNNVVGQVQPTLIPGPTGVRTRDYPVSQLTGTGPWTVELLFTEGTGGAEHSLGTATVEVSDSPPPVTDPAIVAAQKALAAAKQVLAAARLQLKEADTRAEKQTARMAYFKALKQVGLAHKALRIAIRANR